LVAAAGAFVAACVPVLFAPVVARTDVLGLTVPVGEQPENSPVSPPIPASTPMQWPVDVAQWPAVVIEELACIIAETKSECEQTVQSSKPCMWCSLDVPGGFDGFGQCTEPGHDCGGLASLL